MLDPNPLASTGSEKGDRAIAIWRGSTGNGRNPMFNGRRQPPCGGTSRMTRECQVRFCERLGVKFPGPTRQNLRLPQRNIDSCLTSVSKHYASEAVQPFVAPSMSSLDEHRRGDLGAGRGPRRQGRLPDRRRRYSFLLLPSLWCGLTSHGRRSPNSLFMSLAAHNSEFRRWSGGVDRRWPVLLCCTTAPRCGRLRSSDNGRAT